jgi:signal transduction histidine kinase
VEERNRLARELHDSVTQSLYSVTLLNQASLTLWERDPGKSRERLERAVELAQGALAEMRALIFELRPMALQEEGLISALRKHLTALKTREQLNTELVVQGEERRLPNPVEEAAFRITQESLNNVSKHAQATHVTVTLTFKPKALQIVTEDDGVGFTPQAKGKTRTLGMSSMRERAEAIRGTIKVDSAPGRGTRVITTLPVPSAD